ncbi:MAG: 2,4-dienoyl-CoA reductase [Planctomycetes bacterium]|jgi:NAD(P)-dependent dehydrogenase (short-subunit alcohol dehydrogenase family)|nr:2,4-dienoyl-CoA reductase [Planctomycetota bacterium]
MSTPWNSPSEELLARFLPDDTFAGQVAVITGGGTGLGREISRGLAKRGARVVILSRNPDHHASILDEASSQGWDLTALPLDVRQADTVHETAAAIVESHGQVDILVNNAAGNFVCPAERMSANAWRSVLGIVLDGTFYCSRSFGRSMIQSGGGQILNVVATYAWTGMPGVVHSACAKSGVLTMTKTLAAEWSRFGIRVNAIAPGPFESDGASANLWPEDMQQEAFERTIPLGRFGTREEVAAHCIYLLSPVSNWVSGTCLTVDGGSSLPRPMWQPGTSIERVKATGGDGKSE